MWLAGYSLTYLTYGISLSREIVNKHLPRLTDRIASGVAYYGYPAGELESGDLGGSPDFCLGLMTFFFTLLISVTAFMEPVELPMPMVDVGGICYEEPWPSYVFAGVAVLSVMTVCAG